MNQQLFNFLFSLSHYPAIARVALFVSNVLIYILFVVIILFVFFTYKNNFRELCVRGCIVCSAGVGAWLASKVLKVIFHIPRPFITMHFIPLTPESGFSLPSTHATIFAALSVVAFSMNRTLGITFSVCTFFIGISRVVLGVHYPFDILVGSILGILIGLLFVKIGKKMV